MSLNDQIADVAVTSITMGRPIFEGANKLTLEDSFDVADKVFSRIEKPKGGLAGYKIAWNTDALMEKFGLDHPGMGRVFNKQLRESGAKLALADFNEMMIEIEIVAILGEDLKPGITHSPQSVKTAVNTFTVGFEILNKLSTTSEPTAPAILAHNVFNAGAVLGDIRIPADDLDISKLTTRLSDRDNVVFEDVGVAPQDPFEAIAFLANHYTRRGFTLFAGQLILCGSHIPLYAITEAGEFSASMSSLGEVSFSVV